MKAPRRREGFPGQHHCVLPRDVSTRAIRHPLLRGLLPTDAGLYPHAAGHFVERANGAPGTVLIVCCNGRGWVTWQTRTSAMNPGDVALLPPNQPHAYGADDGDPWTIEWVHYTGAETHAWRALLIEGETAVVHVPPESVGELKLATVHERLEIGYGDLQLLGAAAALRHSLTTILQLRRSSGMLPSATDAVDATAVWMRENLDRKVTLAALARRAFLSPSHYSAIFRRRYGFAPIDWLLRQRVHRACSLLQTRSDKIAAIAANVGVKDPYYFSRLFRKIMGLSPEQFRRAK